MNVREREEVRLLLARLWDKADRNEREALYDKKVVSDLRKKYLGKGFGEVRNWSGEE